MSEEARIIAREKVETLLGNLLRIGVILSLTTIVTGVTILLVNNPAYFHSTPSAKEVIGTGEGYPHTPLAVFEGALRGDGPSVIMLGVFLLIATPVVRVLTSIIAFAMQRDWLFTLITTSVLIVLLIGFLLGLRSRKSPANSANEGSSKQADVKSVPGGNRTTAQFQWKNRILSP